MIIINADDFGMNENATKAIKFSLEQNLIDTTTMIVNSSYVDKIDLNFIREYSDKIGLHINLTEGIPLTKNILNCSNIVKNGSFYNNPKLRKFPKCLFLSIKEKRAIEDEIEAQILKFLKINSTSNFIDSHHHIHTVPSIFRIFKKVALKYGFKRVRITRNINIRNRIKKLLKNIFNIRIKRDFITMDKFGSFIDFSKEKLNTKKLNIEIMTHPYCIENEIVDLTSNYNMSLMKGTFKHDL